MLIKCKKPAPIPPSAPGQGAGRPKIDPHKPLIYSTRSARCTVYVQYMYSIWTLRKRTNTVHILYIYCTYDGEGTLTAYGRVRYEDINTYLAGFLTVGLKFAGQRKPSAQGRWLVADAAVARRIGAAAVYDEVAQ